MIDTVQLILLLVIVGLTVLLTILGIQVFYILKDIRKLIEKTNHILDNAGSITDNISGPLGTVSSFLTNLKAGSIISVAKLIRNFLNSDDDERK